MRQTLSRISRQTKTCQSKVISVWVENSEVDLREVGILKVKQNGVWKAEQRHFESHIVRGHAKIRLHFSQTSWASPLVLKNPETSLPVTKQDCANYCKQAQSWERRALANAFVVYSKSIRRNLFGNKVFRRISQNGIRSLPRRWSWPTPDWLDLRTCLRYIKFVGGVGCWPRGQPCGEGPNRRWVVDSTLISKWTFLDFR